jgi:hypothetical protein
VSRASLTLPPVQYPFPALAAYAAIAPLGREREIAMACLLAGRLIAGTLPPLSLGTQVRQARAARARAWLSSHQMSVRLRGAFERLYDATAEDSMAAIPRHLRAVLEMSSARLDEGSRQEMASLLGEIQRGIGD